jgi:translation initiation factor 1
MPEICPKCGLPKEICACGEISKEQARITVRTDRRRYGKYVTLVEGLEADARTVGKLLKAKLACGGTSKNGTVELQGNHKKKIKEILEKEGFPSSTIDIV